MQQLLSHRSPSWSRRAALALVTLATVAGLLAPFACTDAPTAPSAPGDTVIDDSMQDAVAQFTQDVYQPAQGVGDGAADAVYPDAGPGSTTYIDASSPATACSTCQCVGYCLENGTTLTFPTTVIQGYCKESDLSAPAVGCNPLPANCTTCDCVLAAIQPPLACYPECTMSLGYIDVYCNTP